MKNHGNEAKVKVPEVNNEGNTKIEDIVKLKYCLTCVYRKMYPATMRNGQPVFFRFICGLSLDSLKEVVRPEDKCNFWKDVTLGVD
jgi:hypothetical protein